MNYDMGDGAEALRARLRGLIADEIPSGWLGAFSDDPADLARAQGFCKTLADEGLLTLAWPEECGGGGGNVWDQTVVREEMWAHHEPRGAQYMGLNWVGPAIMAYGTDTQKDLSLPPIAAGTDAPFDGAVEDHWRYAQAATVSSGTIEMQRVILSRSLIGAAR